MALFPFTGTLIGISSPSSSQTVLGEGLVGNVHMRGGGVKRREDGDHANARVHVATQGVCRARG